MANSDARWVCFAADLCLVNLLWDTGSRTTLYTTYLSSLWVPTLLSHAGFGVLQHLQMQPTVVISQSGSEEKQNKIARNIFLGGEED